MLPCPSRPSVRSTFQAAGLLLAFAVAACSDTTKNSDGGDDASIQLTTISNNVILATYVDLDAKAALL
jgi:hypothetical protein